MPVFQLIYVSSLASDEPELLPSILEVSMRNNAQKGITGMMLYSDGSVMQVLEGEKEVVLRTFQTIQTDRRHTGIFVLIEHEVQARQFGTWSMGFKQLSKADLERLPAAAQVFKAQPNEIALRVSAGSALGILKTFAVS